ncbi:hypothetical protein HPB50_003269 [Hyalomma asiaticum]|uniref:Uncharacterized protein n=1 Tax=Hyalomma asiaticum TaxID=266040 RepID=A0ACB7RWZ8_HYAAI|nr:hypothetical protein HPB50_003269 [Hyalomma asiaticum]
MSKKNLSRWDDTLKEASLQLTRIVTNHYELGEKQLANKEKQLLATHQFTAEERTLLDTYRQKKIHELNGKKQKKLKRDNLHLPTFWRNNQQLWFAQLEGTFDLRHIFSEISRFRRLLCNLSPEVAQEVTDVIAAPLNDAPYQRLKQSIVDRTATSESVLLRHLLTSEELGDRRPSQLLNSMRQLLRSSDVDLNGALFR